MKEYRININGTTYNVSIEETGATNQSSIRKEEPVKTTVQDIVSPKQEIVKEQEEKPVQKAAPILGGNDYLFKSPLPGIILDIPVKVGDSVKKGEKILLLEAMKMENNIISEKDGIVKSIEVTKGDSVYEGDTLMVLSI